MITTLLLALSVGAAAADAPAAKPVPDASAAVLTPDQLDQAAEARVKGLEDCVDTLNYFRDDLKKKKAELDKEFKGKIPSSFASLFNLKAGRVARQQVACSQIATGADKPIDAAMNSLKTMDGTSSAYTARRKKLGELRERLNKALKAYSAPD